MAMETIDLRGTDHTYDFRLLPGDLPRFWPRWEVMKRAYSVLATYDGSWDISPYPGVVTYEAGESRAANHVWRGGCIYTYEDENGLYDALTAAGYDTLYEEEYIDRYVDLYGPSGGADCS